METIDHASRYAWACGVFGLEPEASQKQVRAAIMSHLEDEDFVPPAGWRQAIRLLGNSGPSLVANPSGYDAFRDARESRVTEEIDEFASRFFALTAAARRAEWTRLTQEAAEFPVLKARLALLQPGLDAEAVHSGEQNPQEATLVDRVLRLFLLKPVEQEAQRRQWLATMTRDCSSGIWRPVVRRVQAKFPKLARLDEDFLGALLTADHGPAAVKAGTGSSTNNDLAAIVARLSSLPAASPASARKAETPFGRLRAIAFRIYGGLLVLIFLFIFLIVLLPRRAHTPSRYVPPTPSNVPSPGELERILSDLEKSDSEVARRLTGRPPRWPSKSTVASPIEPNDFNDTPTRRKAIEEIMKQLGSPPGSNSAPVHPQGAP